MVGQLKPHRRPGVCIAIVGFLPLFAGIMMIAVSNTAQDNSESTMKGIGPACLAIGFACILGGFLFQFVKHKMWKSKQDTQTKDKKYIYNNRNNSRTSSSSSKIARSSIEDTDTFDDINTITEYPETQQDEVQDLRQIRILETIDERKEIRRKVRTIEDELNEINDQYAEGTSSALSDKEIAGAEGSSTPLPGSMYNLHDSD